MQIGSNMGTWREVQSAVSRQLCLAPKGGHMPLPTGLFMGWESSWGHEEAQPRQTC